MPSWITYLNRDSRSQTGRALRVLLALSFDVVFAVADHITLDNGRVIATGKRELYCCIELSSFF